MVFCRTNLDCDHLEAFLNAAGGGQTYKGKKEKGVENPFSCCVLAGQRTMEERRRNLAAFKEGDIRFLVCTDVVSAQSERGRPGPPRCSIVTSLPLAASPCSLPIDAQLPTTCSFVALPPPRSCRRRRGGSTSRSCRS